MLNKMKAKLEELIAKRDAIEIDPDDYIDEYEECYDADGDITIGTLTFTPSAIVRELDPTAYRCGLVDYVDSLSVEDTPEYKKVQDQIDELTELIDDFETLLKEQKDDKTTIKRKYQLFLEQL